MRQKRKHRGLLSNQDFINVGSFCFCIWSTSRICGQCHLRLWLWPFQHTSAQLPAADTCICLPGCLSLLMTDCCAAFGWVDERSKNVATHPFHKWIKQGLTFSSSLACNTCVFVRHRLRSSARRSAFLLQIVQRPFIFCTHYPMMKMAEILQSWKVTDVICETLKEKRFLFAFSLVFGNVPL